MARMRAPQRRRQLLETAVSLFGQRGYHGTTTRELAKAAGITEPILYRHFEDKLDLFVTLIGEVGREVLAAWRAVLQDIDDPRKRLRTLLEANPATHTRGQRAYRVIFQAMTELDGEPAIASAIRRHMSMLHGFLEDELGSLQKAGVVRRDEPAASLAWLLINVGTGYGIVAPLGAPRLSPTTGRKSIQRLLEELLAR
ncbi:MAG: TetR/AcrR family transcriptional regulator [Planctomycetota bacterium]|nr:TetR/AcrR family transcriptional regulator [Planctomycetota bacterium]